MRTIIRVIVVLVHVFCNAAQAEEPKKMLWYGDQAYFTTKLRIHHKEMAAQRPKASCTVPFILQPLNELAVTIAISKDVTGQTITIDGKMISYIPFIFRPNIAISIAHPLHYGRIKLDRQRIRIKVPPIASFFVKTNPFFASIEGIFGDRINLHITLVSVENPEKYCPVIYRLTGERLENPLVF